MDNETVVGNNFIEGIESRENAISTIINKIPKNIKIVCTTGVASRELYELRDKNSGSHSSDFLCVGGMGHASQVAAGLALNSKEKVVCIDGDGAALMHLGSLAVSAQCENLIHVVMNNGVHDSVGAQPTYGRHINFKDIATSLGYKSSHSVETINDLERVIDSSFERNGSTFIEVKCCPGYRTDLGRPKLTPKEQLMGFMSTVHDK